MEVKEFLMKLIIMYKIGDQEAGEHESESEDDVEGLMDKYKSTRYS